MEQNKKRLTGGLCMANPEQLDILKRGVQVCNQ
jgi:hypothetical protein